jgi:hypothetical protein
VTTRKNDIDEELQSQTPPPEEVEAVEVPQEEEPTPIKRLTAEQFIQQAQEPQLANLIDDGLDKVRQTTGATWKQMLRGYALVLRSIATSMPWDEDEGLDAKRFHIESKTALPSWRDCIGALLQLEFSKPEEATPEDVAVDAEIEDSQREEIQAEEEAEAAKAEDVPDVDSE